MSLLLSPPVRAFSASFALSPGDRAGHRPRARLFGDGAKSARAGYQRDAGGRGEGFTLIEFLVYLAVVAAVLAMVTVLSADLLRGRAKSSSLEVVNQNARLALERVTGAVRNADSVDPSSPGCDHAVGCLSLQMPAAAVDPTVFTLASGVLTLAEGAGSPVRLTSPEIEVTNLVFTHLIQPGSEGVQMQLGLRRVNPSGASEFDAQRSYVVAAIVR